MLTRSSALKLTDSGAGVPCRIDGCPFYGSAAAGFLCSRCFEVVRSNNGTIPDVNKAFSLFHERRATAMLLQTGVKLGTEEHVRALRGVCALVTPDRIAGSIVLLLQTYGAICTGTKSLVVFKPSSIASLAALWRAKSGGTAASNILVSIAFMPWLLMGKPGIHSDSICYFGCMGEPPFGDARLEQVTVQCVAVLADRRFRLTAGGCPMNDLGTLRTMARVFGAALAASSSSV